MITVLTIFVILKMGKYIDIGYTTLILAFLLIIVNLYKMEDVENFDNNEAIKNIASIYN